MKRKLIDKLYDFIDHDADNSASDEENGYLTENIGSDGDAWYWYFDGHAEAAINERTEMIVTDTETINRLFQ